MASTYTTNLGLTLPTTGELSGTWGDVVNAGVTSLLDSSIAGTTTLSADADVTLSVTDGAANQARSAVILWTASNGATPRNITVPSHTKAYIVINAGTGSIVVKGAATTGVTIATGVKALIAWNGSDFVRISSSAVALADITGLGTGVATALAINVGSAGAPVVNGSALGTPSSGSAANLTSFPTLNQNTTGTAATVTGATQASITSAANLVTTGALNSGSITSGFGAIDVGADAISGGAFIAGGMIMEGSHSNSPVTNSSWVQAPSGSGLFLMSNAVTTYYYGLLSSGAASVNTTNFSVTSTGLNSTVIGATTPAAGSFTTLSSAGTVISPIYMFSTGESALRTYSRTAGVQIISYQSVSGAPYTKTTDIVSNADSGVASTMRLMVTSAAGNPAPVITLADTGAAVTGTLSATGGINSTTIGATTPAAGSFTTLTATGNITRTIATTAGYAFITNISGYSGAYTVYADGTSTRIGNEVALPIDIQSNSTTVGRFSSAGLAVTGAGSTTGNQGVGFSPVATYSTVKDLQVGSVGGVHITGNTSANGSAGVGLNVYYEPTAATATYGATAAASSYTQYAGSHKWNSAPSGTAGAAITFTQVLAVDKDQSLALQGATSQTGTGITFPATQNASADANTLDDWEAGTWAPSQGAGLTVVGGFSSSGTYLKKGDEVTVWGRLTGGTTVATTAGTVAFGNLPFVAANLAPGVIMNSASDTVGGVVIVTTSGYMTTMAAIQEIRFSITYSV